MGPDPSETASRVLKLVCSNLFMPGSILCRNRYLGCAEHDFSVPSNKGRIIMSDLPSTQERRFTGTIRTKDI